MCFKYQSDFSSIPKRIPPARLCGNKTKLSLTLCFREDGRGKRERARERDELIPYTFLAFFFSKKKNPPPTNISISEQRECLQLLTFNVERFAENVICILRHRVNSDFAGTTDSCWRCEVHLWK